MSRRIGLIVAFLGAALLNRAALAAETSFADIKRVIETGQLVVALPALQRPPYVIDVAGKDPEGFDPWLARKLAATLKVALKLNRAAKSSDELIDLVATGKADLALGGILMTAQRALKVRFSRPYVREATSLLLNRRDTMPFHGICPTLDEITDLLVKPNEVALRKGSRAEAVVRRMVPDAAPKLFDDPFMQFAAVLAGDVLISVQHEAESRYLLHRHPSARIRLRSCLGGAPSILVAIAVSPNAPDLVRWVNTFLEVELIDLTAAELLQYGQRNKLWP